MHFFLLFWDLAAATTRADRAIVPRRTRGCCCDALFKEAFEVIVPLWLVWVDVGARGVRASRSERLSVVVLCRLEAAPDVIPAVELAGHQTAIATVTLCGGRADDLARSRGRGRRGRGRGLAAAPATRRSLVVVERGDRGAAGLGRRGGGSGGAPAREGRGITSLALCLALRLLGSAGRHLLWALPFRLALCLLLEDTLVVHGIAMRLLCLATVHLCTFCEDDGALLGGEGIPVDLFLLQKEIAPRHVEEGGVLPHEHIVVHQRVRAALTTALCGRVVLVVLGRGRGPGGEEFVVGQRDVGAVPTRVLHRHPRGAGRAGEEFALKVKEPINSLEMRVDVRRASTKRESRGRRGLAVRVAIRVQKMGEDVGRSG